MPGTVSPTHSLEDLDKKADIEHKENAPGLPASSAGTSSSGIVKDAALEVLGDSAKPVHVTAEQDRAVLRKIDLWLMPIIFMVYFLQQLDKYVL